MLFERERGERGAREEREEIEFLLQFMIEKCILYIHVYITYAYTFMSCMYACTTYMYDVCMYVPRRYVVVEWSANFMRFFC